ncbi:hypothetical protein [Pikeienuella sp. HZG-20]|uniref:hypothetical protein n=1 Tax=Paludibacillus litoralis TaxID=3133267 RepID=UPI0030EF8A94
MCPAILGAPFFLKASAASAHAFGARYDLPLPLHFYLGAAGVAVAASFVAALVFLRQGRTTTVAINIPLPPALTALAAISLRITGIVVLAVLLGAAAFGPPSAADNLATIFVWVIWWVGYLLFSALVAPTWPAIDPFRGVFTVFCRLFGRDPEASASELPPVAGYIAPAGLLALAWVELISDRSEDPKAVGVLISSYLFVTLLCASRFGMAWFRVADPLGRVFDLVGRMAVFRPTAASTLTIGLPGEGLLGGRQPIKGETALVCVLIGTVLFDGFSETPAWAAVLDHISQSQSLRSLLLFLREQGVDLLKLIRFAGLITTIAAFLAAYWLLSWAMRKAAGDDGRTRSVAANFSGALLPIAIAYHLSHYVSYLMIAGQLAAPAASDPFGLGWDLVGAADRSIDISVIGARHVWWIGFFALILGHGLSVLIGHRRALIYFGEARSASASQLPMMVGMVCLTMMSLWILSQPITK